MYMGDGQFNFLKHRSTLKKRPKISSDFTFLERGYSQLNVPDYLEWAAYILKCEEIKR